MRSKLFRIMRFIFGSFFDASAEMQRAALPPSGTSVEKVGGSQVTNA